MRLVSEPMDLGTTVALKSLGVGAIKIVITGPTTTTAMASEMMRLDKMIMTEAVNSEMTDLAVQCLAAAVESQADVAGLMNCHDIGLNHTQETKTKKSRGYDHSRYSKKKRSRV